MLPRDKQRDAIVILQVRHGQGDQFNQPLLGFVKVSSVSVPIIAVLCPFPLLVSKRVYSTMHCIQSGKDGSNCHI